jgi:hypothetical protein
MPLVLLLVVVVFAREVLAFLEGGAVFATDVATGSEEEEVLVVSAAAEADPDDDEVALRLGARPIQYAVK